MQTASKNLKTDRPMLMLNENYSRILPNFWLFKPDIVDVIWYHWFIRSPLIVKVGKVNFSQNVSPELNESSCVTHEIITQAQAEDEAHTESYEVSEEHLLTESHSDQHLEPPSSGLEVPEPVCQHGPHVCAAVTLH